MSSFLRYALFCGSGAALGSMAAVMALSRVETGSAWRGVNATSHFLWGPRDAPRAGADIRHTVPGVATNAGAAFFWSSLFAAYLHRRPRRNAPALLRDASILTGLAAIVDYALVPRRLRPGWELALSPPSVALSLAAMACGLAAGALAAQSGERPPSEAEDA